MPFDFKDKCVVVTGGSKGIGRSIALAFAEAGAKVSICARGKDALETTRKEIEKFGGATHAESCDLADGAAITRYIPAAAKAIGGIDLLVNNAPGYGLGDDQQRWDPSLTLALRATIPPSPQPLPLL